MRGPGGEPRITQGRFVYERTGEPAETQMGVGGALSVLARYSGYQTSALESEDAVLGRALLRALETTHPAPLAGPTPAWEELIEAVYVIAGHRATRRRI